MKRNLYFSNYYLIHSFIKRFFFYVVILENAHGKQNNPVVSESVELY